MNNGRRQLLEALSMASNMGFIMLVNAAVGLFIGKGFDKWLDSSPWGVAVGTMFGLIAGLRAVMRKAAELGGNDGKDKDDRRHS